MSEPKIRLYSVPGCAACDQTKEFLSSRGVQFTEIDISENLAARAEVIAKSGQRRIPVLDLGNEVVVGFNVAKLCELFGQFPSTRQPSSGT